MTEPTRFVKEDSVEWRLNGKLHREVGPAIEWEDGSKDWYLNDRLHRVDGPAVERADGPKSWWLNDRLHREDGPSVVYPDGTKQWHLNGQRLTEHAFRARLKDKCFTADEIKTLVSYGIMI